MNTQQQIIAGVVVLAVIIIALIFWFPVAAPATPAETATTTNTGSVPVTSTAKPTPTTQPVSGTVAATDIPKAVAISTYLKKDAKFVYMYVDTNPTGVDEYRIIPDVDPATFVALTTPVVVEEPTVKNGTVITKLGQGSAAYYKDKNNVYVFSYYKTETQIKIGIEVVQGAKVSSFKVLSTQYGKDSAAVYALKIPQDAVPHAPDSYTWYPYDMSTITDADVLSFVVLTGTTLGYDAHDKNRTYKNGSPIGTYP